ncbi:Hypothetical predicted protein [Paramuricea clavata]|uniref:Uncharacterized protein n=1 Tax=Paramuricea clavata TaxID=317549 RepID=A0A6S7IVD1_PARCT|nr:Hypothetical predicted protein [Paramuricea clavata]
MGHCSCYSEIETVDTALARESMAKSERDGTVIPSNITPDTFIQFAADNNDINEETLDGKDTTHATTLVVYQQKPFGPMPRKEVLADHTKKKRSLTKVNSCDENLECSAYGKRPIVTDFLGQIGTESFHTTTDAYISSCRMDLTWALGRMSPTKLFDIAEVTKEETDQPIRSWSGFNSMLFPGTAQPTKAQNICSSLQQRDMVITFDLAIYAKAKQIQWKFPEEFSDTVIRMGGFHIALNFLAVLGKKYQNSGLEDVLIESGAYGSGSVMALMKRKSYAQTGTNWSWKHYFV